MSSSSNEQHFPPLTSLYRLFACRSVEILLEGRVTWLVLILSMLNGGRLSCVDGKEMVWPVKRRVRPLLMKSEPLKRREEKKEIGVISPLPPLFPSEDERWNCSELEILQRRFSALIEGKKSLGQEEEEEEEEEESESTTVLARMVSLYSSLGTRLHLCPSSVRLFVLGDLEVCSLEQWRCIQRGFPLWLLNSGENPRRPAELRFFLLEKSTGFLLWSDRLSCQSRLLRPAPLTLTFRHSSGHSSIMLKFDSKEEEAFARFYSYFQENQLISSANPSSIKVRKRRVKKSDLSSPSHLKHFTHLSSLVVRLENH